MTVKVQVHTINCLESINTDMGGPGWVAGASHGSMLQSVGQLVTVEAPGLPVYPSSTQLDAVINYMYSNPVNPDTSLSADKYSKSNC